MFKPEGITLEDYVVCVCVCVLCVCACVCVCVCVCVCLCKHVCVLLSTKLLHAHKYLNEHKNG